MGAFSETANFRADDSDALVAASLACYGCLSDDVAWTLDPSGYDPLAQCECRCCGERWPVYLTPVQALRLALHVGRPLDSRAGPAAEPNPT